MKASPACLVIAGIDEILWEGVEELKFATITVNIVTSAQCAGPRSAHRLYRYANDSGQQAARSRLPTP
jgi:hypothetical protein